MGMKYATISLWPEVLMMMIKFDIWERTYILTPYQGGYIPDGIRPTFVYDHEARIARLTCLSCGQCFTVYESCSCDSDEHVVKEGPATGITICSISP